MVKSGLEVSDFVNDLCSGSTVEELELWKKDIQTNADGIDVNSKIGQLFISIINSHIESQQMQALGIVQSSTKTKKLM